MPRAILFDLGSTLWDDYPTELYHWQLLVSLLARHGVETTFEDLLALSERVIASFCPSLTRSMIFQLVGGRMDLYQAVVADLQSEILERFTDPAEFRRLNPLFPGVHELLETLAKTYPLAIVSQNFTEAQQWMKFHGIDEYFSAVSLSYKEQLFKPDPRLFLHACSCIGVEPQAAVMVGDRLDNDIWPANRLRMQSVRVLADPYRIQRPRYHNDVPAYTLGCIGELLDVVPL
jgi:HAD superfamily hydrolase (TIGR01549 family)